MPSFTVDKEGNKDASQAIVISVTFLDVFLFLSLPSSQLKGLTNNNMSGEANSCSACPCMKESLHVKITDSGGSQVVSSPEYKEMITIGCNTLK